MPPMVNQLGAISFHNINYVVKQHPDSTNKQTKCPINIPLFKFRETKQILFNVSGKFTQGMHAILGPSGCGKSSLLDILADRKDPNGLTGDIFIDGSQKHPLFRYTIGYVVQEDICSGTLTVRENLNFSINLRAPATLSSAERNCRVSDVLAELGLEACADTRVGTEFLRGISGGEKKRTCIGMELVLSPTILMLDEPTTGLDAATATNIMSCLQSLSRQGRTIIFSIHQPRYSIFKMFDTVMLMCKGRCIYHASSANIVRYLSKHGYRCDPYENPADFALDVLIDISIQPDILEKLNKSYNATCGDVIRTLSIDENITDKKGRQQQRLTMRSLGSEILYLSQRTLRNSFRNPLLTISQIFVSIAMGLMIGLFFFDLKKDIDSGIKNRLGAIFFITISQIFINVTAIDALLKERILFIHEYASGYYRIFSFFISKLLCDTIPMRVIPSCLFSIISYFMMGLTRTSHQFFIYLLTIFITSLFGAALCFFVSAGVSIFPVALILVILICIIMVMFSGFILDIDSVMKWLAWLQWISVCRYSSNLLTINEIKGLTFCISNSTNICPMTGEQVLDELGIAYASSWDLWKNFVAVATMTVIFFILAYIQLIRIKKTK